MEVTEVVDRANAVTIRVKSRLSDGKYFIHLDQDNSTICLDRDTFEEFFENLLTATRTMLKPGLDD